MTRFRPCIDLHGGQVKQIVGGTYSEEGSALQTNFVAEHSPAWYAQLYKQDDLEGGHVILLGPGNEDAAREALTAWPGGLQVGGGITASNAPAWIAAGASKIIVTSWLFDGPHLQVHRLSELRDAIGAPHIVIDLSCRRTSQGWAVATQRWQTLTDFSITPQNLEHLAPFCSEFLIHAADVEGRQQGMDEELIDLLGKYSPVPTTYAGGARSLDDLHRIRDLSQGRLDLTIGSALDIFGGRGVTYADCVRFNQEIL